MIFDVIVLFNKILENMCYDKKIIFNEISMVLFEEIGELVIFKVEDDLIFEIYKCVM